MANISADKDIALQLKQISAIAAKKSTRIIATQLEDSKKYSRAMGAGHQIILRIFYSIAKTQFQMHDDKELTKKILMSAK